MSRSNSRVSTAQVKIKFQGFYSLVKIKFQGFYSSVKIKFQGFYSSVKIKFQGFYSSVKIKFQDFYSSVQIKFQGFYSSVKIKSQEYPRSLPGVICFCPGVPFWTELIYMGLQKVYTVKGYDDKNFITFAYCKQSMPEA